MSDQPDEAVRSNEGFAWKMLGPTNTTRWSGVETVYPVPGPGVEWGPWFNHFDPCDTSQGIPFYLAYGPGRWHMSHHITSPYPVHPLAAAHWWPWRANWKGFVAECDDLITAHSIRLKRITHVEFAEIIRDGHCNGSNLRGLVLRKADLSNARLVGINFDGSDLAACNFQNSVICKCTFRFCNLGWANFEGAELDAVEFSDNLLTQAQLGGARL